MSNLNDLAYVYELADKIARYGDSYSIVQEGNLYCPKCAGHRKMSVTGFLSETVPPPPDSLHEFSKPGIPFVFTYICRQWDSTFTALVYKGPNGQELVVCPSIHGGLSTPNSPHSVKYYLDQAYRSQTAGANSAAIVMFRSALEHLLYEQGYDDTTLFKNITHVADGTHVVPRPNWTVDLNPQFLDVMRKLGNGAVHHNKGDISLQSTFDNELIEKVKLTFLYLLDTVYEKPIRDAQILQDPNNASGKF